MKRTNHVQPARYAGGGSPGWDTTASEHDYSLQVQLTHLLRQSGHATATVQYQTTGYQGARFCSIYRVQGLEDSSHASNVSELLRKTPYVSHVSLDKGGSASIYVPRMQRSGGSLTTLTFSVLSVIVLCLLTVLYVLLHYVDPRRFPLSSYVDPF
jgi:hypothetical protein